MEKLAKNPQRPKQKKTARLSGKISNADLEFIQKKAKHYRISQSDFLVLASKYLPENGIWRSTCRTCGHVDVHD